MVHSPWSSVFGQEGISAILMQVEANNPELQAQTRLTTAQKLENRVANNLPDPTLSYAHVWDRDDSSVTEGELIVSQSFDFPTLYATRSRMNRLRSAALDHEAEARRQDILLQTKLVCLDLIHLQQVGALLLERLSCAEQLAEIYRRRLETGDANVLETNKINLELLNVRTEARMNQVALTNKLKELTALNGGQSLAPGRGLPGYGSTAVTIPGLTDYPAAPLPADFGAVCTQLLAEDPTLQALQSETDALSRQLSASRQGWLPRLELGYRRNTESGHPMNGVVVGFSIPLFENRGKVRHVRDLQQSATYGQESARLQASSTLWSLYEEASSLHQAMQEYENTLASQHDLDLLRQALDGGEISLTDYLLEASGVYESQENLLEIKRQYHVAMARIYKCRL